MMVDESAWPTIGIVGRDQRAAPTSTGHRWFGGRSLPVERKVAGTTESNAVSNIEAEFWVVCIIFEVMSRQPTLVLFAPSVTLLANIAVTFQHSVSPGLISGVLESLPRFSALPFVVFLSRGKDTALVFGLEDLRLGGFRKFPSLGPSP